VDRQHRSDRRFRRGKGVAPLRVPDVRRRGRNRRPGEDLPGGDVDRGEEGVVHLQYPLEGPGALDKVAGGYGGSVGRRAGEELRWATSSTSGRWSTSGGKRLLLKARMKVAGRRGSSSASREHARSDRVPLPERADGQAVLYSMMPFHAFIFRDMVRSIVRQAEGME